MKTQDQLQFEFGKSFRRCFGVYRKQVRRARQPHPEAVYDLRIASRRLMAALEAVHLLLRSNRAEKIRKRIGRIVKELGPLRDAQMQLELARTELTAGPCADEFIAKLEKHEKRLRRKASIEIARIHTDRLQRPLANLNRRVCRPLPDVDPDLFLFTLNSIIDATFAGVVDRRRKLDLHDHLTFHRLRVRFKTFRYLIEFLQSTLQIHTDQIEHMKRYQDTLGKMHDLMVLTAKAELFYKEHGARKPLEVADLRRLKGRLESMVRVFMADDAETIYDFWKSVPVRVSATESKQPIPSFSRHICPN